MKRYLLSLLIIVGMFIITCGNKPPAEFYEGTPEDSTSIMNILINDFSEFLLTTDQFTADAVPITIPPVSYEALADSYFKGDSTKVKIHVDNTILTFSDTVRVYDLWFTKDTTCTVYLRDTFTVQDSVTFDSIAFGYYFYPPGDTTTLLDTVIGMDSTGSYSKIITGEGVRHIFFEPVREIDSVIVDTLTNDTTIVWGAVIEPFDWVLKKIGYGAYYFPNKGGDVPIINQVTLTPESGDPVTVFSSNTSPDSSIHAMNRLRHVDSLIQFTSGESLDVDVTVLAPPTDSATIYVSCDGANRAELPAGSGSVLLSGTGIVNLYIEVVYDNGYYYVIPDKGYDATVWLIPINLGGTP